MKLRFDPDALTRELVASRETATCTPALGAMFLDAVAVMAKGPQYRGYAFHADLVGNALLALVPAPRSFREGRGDPNGWLAHIIRQSFGKTIVRENDHVAKTLRMAVDQGAEISPIQMDWLRAHEARKAAKRKSKRTVSTRVDRAA